MKENKTTRQICKGKLPPVTTTTSRDVLGALLWVDRTRSVQQIMLRSSHVWSIECAASERKGRRKELSFQGRTIEA